MLRATDALGGLFQRNGQMLDELLGHDLPEPRQNSFPVMQQSRGVPGSGFPGVALGERFQVLFPVWMNDALPDERVRVHAQGEQILGIVYERHSTGKTSAEIVADSSQDHDRAAGHIFAAVGTAALDDRIGTGVPNCKPLPGLSGSEEFAVCRAIQYGIADDRVIVAAQG